MNWIYGSNFQLEYILVVGFSCAFLFTILIYKSNKESTKNLFSSAILGSYSCQRQRRPDSLSNISIHEIKNFIKDFVNKKKNVIFSTDLYI